ncbi:MAG: T9SS type A sorting domain-containing protein, partial [Flavobacteriales bacterium]
VKPNPASDVLFIENTTGTVSTVSVYNVTGAKVLADQTFQAEARMDVSALPRGMYIVRIQNGSTERVVRVALK